MKQCDCCWSITFEAVRVQTSCSFRCCCVLDTMQQHMLLYIYLNLSHERKTWKSKIEYRLCKNFAKILMSFRLSFILCLLSFVLFHFIFTVQCHSNSFRTFVWVIFTRHCYFRLVAFGIIPGKSRALQTESSMQIHYYNSFNLLYKRVYMLIFPWISHFLYQYWINRRCVVYCSCHDPELYFYVCNIVF